MIFKFDVQEEWTWNISSKYMIKSDVRVKLKYIQMLLITRRELPSHISSVCSIVEDWANERTFRKNSFLMMFTNSLFLLLVQMISKSLHQAWIFTKQTNKKIIPIVMKICFSKVKLTKQFETPLF